MRAIMLALLLVSCTDGAADDTADTDTDTDTDADTDTDTDIGPTGLVSGSIADSSGSPVVGANVNLCLLVCSTVETDLYGDYAFDALVADTYSYHVVPPQGSGLGQPLIPFTIDADGIHELDVVLPGLAGWQQLPGGPRAEVEIAPGVFVTAQVGDLDVKFEDPPDEVNGAMPSTAEFLPVGFDGTVIAMWYLEPYEAEAESGLPIRLANQWSLPSGNTYELWRSDYWSYDFVQVGEFTASDSELTSSALLDQLTTLALVDPN